MKIVVEKGKIKDDIDSVAMVDQTINWVWQFRPITGLIRHFLG